MFEFFTAWRHAYLVAMLSPYITPSTFMQLLPTTVEGVANIAGC